MHIRLNLKDFLSFLSIVTLQFSVFCYTIRSVFNVLKKKSKHAFANACTSVCFIEDGNQRMLNNAAFCRMSLLPDNIPISDSGFENVNAFNKVNPHLHQTGKTAEAPTHSCKRHEHVRPLG